MDFSGRFGALRHRELGAFEVVAVEVVRTDRVLTEDAPALLARVPFGRPRPA